MSKLENLMLVSITLSVAGKPANPDIDELPSDICSIETTINLSGGDGAEELVEVLTAIATAAKEQRLYGWMTQDVAEAVAGSGEIVPLTMEDYATRFAAASAESKRGGNA